MLDIMDPTIETARERIDYAPRPENLRGLRIGLLDNTRQNAEAVLLALAQKLEHEYGMKVETLVHKHQRAPLADAQLAELRGRTDFVITGVGD